MVTGYDPAERVRHWSRKLTDADAKMHHCRRKGDVYMADFWSRRREVCADQLATWTQIAKEAA